MIQPVRRACAICPSPVKKASSLFCSPQCAGKVREKPKRPWVGPAAAQVNYRARVAWGVFRPQFEAWMREFNP